MYPTRIRALKMKKLFNCSMVALATISFVSCNNTSKSNQKEVDSINVEVVEDTTLTRGDNEVFDAKAAPSGTEVQSGGFGRCLESGCYCKEFKGRGQTCRNCGHAYKRHY